jgi:hypothetical protein
MELYSNPNFDNGFDDWDGTNRWTDNGDGTVTTPEIGEFNSALLQTAKRLKGREITTRVRAKKINPEPATLWIFHGMLDVTAFTLTDDYQTFEDKRMFTAGTETVASGLSDSSNQAIYDSFSVSVELPLFTHLTLSDGTYGLICKLHTNTFTQDDLDFFTDMPERMIEWYFGTISIPSGIVRGADDRIYFPVETP